MITRASRKPEISYRFRKLPDQAEVSVWLSVHVPATHKRFNQKGVFKISNFWDQQTIRRLEELSVRSDTRWQAVAESAQSKPTVPTIEKLKDLQRSGYDGRVVELTAPYVKWVEEDKCAKRTWNEASVELASLFAEMVRQRGALPEKLLAYVIPLNRDQADERVYALYRSAVWSSQHDLKPEQWQILVDTFLEREDAELAVALAPLALCESEPTRERIPPEVRRAVWIRDQGKCARCGSRERLEYDHIVPVSRGGSNTERNIELLCEFHNRVKSNTIS
jgi:HNH endonuclease